MDRFAVGAIWISDGWNLIIRADRQEVFLKLIASTNINWMGNPVFAQPITTLLKHDVNLMSIGCWPAVNINDVFIGFAYRHD